MRSGFQELWVGLGAGGVAAATFLSLAFGLDFSFVTATVLGAIVGGSLWFIGQRLLPAADPAGPDSIDDDALITQGIEQAARFAALAPRVADPELRRRVGHIADRLREMFVELRRKPKQAFQAQEFVTDFIPRALEMVEHYVSLSSRLGEDDPRLASAAHTVNTIADAVKETHRKLFEEELAEFEAASRTLGDEIRLLHPTLALQDKGRSHE